MKSYIYNSIKSAMLIFTLISGREASGALTNYFNPSTQSSVVWNEFSNPLSLSNVWNPLDHMCKSDDVRSMVENMKYYRLSKDNQGFGNNELYEFGKRESRADKGRKYIAIDGLVVDCFRSDVGSIVKSYGDSVKGYTRVDRFLPWLRAEDPCHNSYITFSNDADLRHLKRPIDTSMVHVPEGVCRNTLQKLRGLINHMKNRGSNMELNIMNSNCSMEDAGKIHEAWYIKDIYDSASERLDCYMHMGRGTAPAKTENDEIIANIDNIFPANVKVAEATIDEIRARKCSKGSFMLYTKDVRRNFDCDIYCFCFGTDVDGAYISDYIDAHPETQDLMLNTVHSKEWWDYYCDPYQKEPKSSEVPLLIYLINLRPSFIEVLPLLGAIVTIVAQRYLLLEGKIVYLLSNLIF